MAAAASAAATASAGSTKYCSCWRGKLPGSRPPAAGWPTASPVRRTARQRRCCSTGSPMRIQRRQGAPRRAAAALPHCRAWSRRTRCAAAATCLSEWPLASSLCASPAKPSSLQRFGDAGAGGQTPDVYGQNPAAGGGAGSFSEEELDAAITAAEADETSFAVTAAAAAAARAEAAETEPAGGGSGRGAFAIAIDAAAFACLREWPLASSLCTSPAQPSSLRRDGNAADADGQSHAVGSGAGAVGISEAELDVAIAAVEADEAAATAMAVATAAAAAAAAAMAAAAEAVEAEAAMGAIAAGGWQQQAGLRFDDGSMERRYVEWQGLQAQKVGQSSAVQDACCARTGAAGCRAVTDSPKPR